MFQHSDTCPYMTLYSRAGCEMFEITITRNYNENSFKDDMKRLYNQLGVDRKKSVFLFTAAQVSY